MKAVRAGARAWTEPPLHADFTAGPRVLAIAAVAAVVGAACAYVAVALLRMIALATNLFYYGRWSAAPATPAGHALGAAAAFVPVLGALIVGLMARFGSEKIRGHGIPEALEAILLRGSRVEPRVAVLKPVSAAVAIGSGGPFGAEGPIIMTGGAVGSLVAQFLHVTAAERKTLLVAGSAAGMTAIFNTPVAAILLAVELMLFEWKPRSLIPVAVATAVAALLRPGLLGAGALFPIPPHAEPTGPWLLGGAAVLGLAGGALAAALSWTIYAVEDAFKRLPLHWMWWPAVGAVAVGLGGLLCPQALGVGYDVIGGLIAGTGAGAPLARLGAVKWVIWAIALGSGTSGGVLAPLLILGGTAGGLAAAWLPAAGAGLWCLVGMGAVLAGAIGVPLTAVVFMTELSRDVNALPVLLVACTAAYGLTVLALRRSIMTEKVARRGFHVSREYAIDPLEILFAREVMRRPARADAARFRGVRAEATVHPFETLRKVVHRMAETGRTRLYVTETGRLLGIVTLDAVLHARSRHLEEEGRRERVLTPPRLVPAPVGRWLAALLSL